MQPLASCLFYWKLVFLLLLGRALVFMLYELVGCKGSGVFAKLTIELPGRQVASKGVFGDRGGGGTTSFTP